MGCTHALWLCTHTHTRTHERTCLHTCIHTHMNTHTHTHVLAHMHTHAHEHTPHTDTHTHVHTHDRPRPCARIWRTPCFLHTLPATPAAAAVRLHTAADPTATGVQVGSGCSSGGGHLCVRSVCVCVCVSLCTILVFCALRQAFPSPCTSSGPVCMCMSLHRITV